MAKQILPQKTVSKKTAPPQFSQRDMKILRIARSHLAPGMSLVKQRRILAQHGVNLTVANPWDEVSDQTIEAILAEVGGAR